MGVKWGYNWDHGGLYPNEREVQAYTDLGRSVFFTVGKLDAGGWYQGIADNPDDYLADAGEQAAYAEVVQLITDMNITHYYTRGS